MMDRLTKRTEYDVAVVCDNCPKHGNCNIPSTCLNVLADRLAAYEDTGLTPEMVLRLIEEYGRLAIECEFYKTQDHAWDADWYKRAEEDETYPLKEAHNATD